MVNGLMTVISIQPHHANEQITNTEIIVIKIDTRESTTTLQGVHSGFGCKSLIMLLGLFILCGIVSTMEISHSIKHPVDSLPHVHSCILCDLVSIPNPVLIVLKVAISPMILPLRVSFTRIGTTFPM